MGEIIVRGDKIEGVVTQPLKQIPDNRGMVMHMLRNDSPLFTGFGEIYFSIVKHLAIKAWKLHTKTRQYYAVPHGQIKLVIHDARVDSPTKGNLLDIIVGLENYGLVIIPPNVWYGFQGLSEGHALVANCINMPHSPGEGESLPFDSDTIPYQW